MTIYQALAKSEELNCFIVHAQAGLRIRAGDNYSLSGDAPKSGWELDIMSTPVTFEAEFIQCAVGEGVLGPITTFIFKGRNALIADYGRKFKVTLEPTE